MVFLISFSFWIIFHKNAFPSAQVMKVNISLCKNLLSEGHNCEPMYICQHWFKVVAFWQQVCTYTYVNFHPSGTGNAFLYAHLKNGTYYAVAMSVRPSVRPSVCPSVRLQHALRYQFETWYIHSVGGTTCRVWVASQLGHFDLVYSQK